MGEEPFTLSWEEIVLLYNSIDNEEFKDLTPEGEKLFSRLEEAIQPRVSTEAPLV